ncbi:MAG: hypothetical protein KDA25_04785 [Phycisphaerales bacterium]|nr:hypothetical protein [Phycisphaerales bacterium]
MKHVAGLAASAILFASPAFGAVTITAEEVGNDVVLTGSGTLDLGAWTFAGAGQIDAFILNDGVAVGPSMPINVFGAPVNFSGPLTIPGIMATTATSGTGDFFGLVFGTIPAQRQLAVPVGYVSGDPLSGTATFANESFASIGLTLGSTTWTWGTPGVDADSLTFTVVPGPGGLAFLTVAGVFGRRRRRRNA